MDGEFVPEINLFFQTVAAIRMKYTIWKLGASGREYK